jgi:alkylation response protein AidB-like acyl-CoA dehydrogenase
MYHSDIKEIVSDSLGRLLADLHPAAYARTTPVWNAERQKALWGRLATDGWLDIAIPGLMEDNGLGYEGTHAIAEHCGRALMTLPFGYHVMVAAPLIHYLGNTHPGEISAILQRCNLTLPVAGEVYATKGDVPLTHFHGQAAVHVQCRIDDLAAGSVTMRKIDLASVVPIDSMDPCVRIGHITAGDQLVESTFRIEPESLNRILYRYMGFELGEMLGAGAVALELSVAYAKERMQFGRKIGEFQSIKHGLADAWINLDKARYALRHFLSLNEQQSNTVELKRVGAIAWRISRTAATNATKIAIQVHGGIGFSWEHDAHLYLKRVYRLASRTDSMAVTLGLA